ncbi:hypothetical protein [Streptomyces sp. NPDC001635]
MGRHTWGKAAAGVVLAAALAAVSGCGSDTDTSSAKKTPTAAAPNIGKATTAFQGVLTDNSGNCSEEAGTCWDEMTDVMESARSLRKAMNAQKNPGPEFWSGAYALIDKMEDGYAIGEDQGGGINNVTSNRVAVFGGAHDLSDWLDEHPVQ